MRSKWLHRKENRKLLLFCNGWGMDENPFVPLKSHEWNVLMFYDYTDLVSDQNLDSLFEDYSDIVLLGWSMGVWAGQQLFCSHRKQLHTALAVNGTLCPVDDRYGIPENVARATIEKFNKEQRRKFYHRMCREQETFHRFLKNQPTRSVESQKRELEYLFKTVGCKQQTKAVYNCVLVSDHDYIIPTANQLDFWPKSIIRKVSGYHFQFYAYQSWDEIIMEAGENVNGSGS